MTSSALSGSSSHTALLQVSSARLSSARSGADRHSYHLTIFHVCVSVGSEMVPDAVIQRVLKNGSDFHVAWDKPMFEPDDLQEPSHGLGACCRVAAPDHLCSSTDLFHVRTAGSIEAVVRR
jgi:hypothetical protein